MQEVKSEYICEVDPGEIRVSPFQPRRVFAEEELKELTASIRHCGLIQPLVVRKIVQNDRILYYELIAGERRWKAAQRAGMKKIPVVVRFSTDEEAAEASLIENIQRVDLNPVEMAEAFKRLIDVFRLTQEAIADKVGKKRSTVANYLRLLTLPTTIRESIQKGEITMGHAKAILSLEDPELKNILHDHIIRNNLNVREAEDESVRLSKTPKKKREGNEEIVRLEQELEKRLQTKVRITNQGNNGGKVSIHYYNLDDLDRLLKVFAIET